MCFNSQVSLVAFGIGILSIIYFLYQKIYEVALLMATIVPMQLVEYFAHIALKNGDKELNRKAGMAGLLIVILQPLIITMYWLFYTIKSETTKTVIYVSQLIFILFGLVLFREVQRQNAMKYSYLKEHCKDCSSMFHVCRLKWDFVSVSPVLTLIFVIFYVWMFSYPYNMKKYVDALFYRKEKHEFNILDIGFFMIGLSFIYMIFVDKLSLLNDSMSTFISVFGSIWCILCVSMGPICLLFPKLATIKH
jgi:hypothetical protein